jgi:iron complex outermembrane receptor protein
MGSRLSACGIAVVGAMVAFAGARSAWAQQQPQTPEPQAPPQAAQPAAPAEGTVELPKMTVETTQPKKTAKKTAAKKKQQPSASAAAAAAPQPQPASEGAVTRPETATGPVNGYNATRTATGIKTDTPLKEIPQSISVVGAEQIRDQGAQSIQDTLRYVPGVVADAYGLDSRSDGAFIRGTEPGEFLDGLRRTSSYYTFNYRLDPYFLERVEVLRGPASVLYGQAPVGGLINSVSKRPQDQPSGEIGIEYGTFDFKQVKFDTTGLITSDGKWSYRLTGLARDSETQVDYVDDDRYAIQPAITYRPDSNTSITLLGHFQKDQTGSSSQFYPIVGTLYPNVNGRTIPRDRFVGEPTDHYDTDAASGTLIAEHRFNSVFKLSHVSRYADIHNDYDSTYAIFWGGYTDSEEETVNRTRWQAITDTQIFNQDTNLEAKFSTGILSHKVLGGVDYMNFRASQGTASANDLSGFNVYNPVYGQAVWTGCVEICSYSNQQVDQVGLYIQDQIRLGNWIAVLGARKDWIETDASGSETQKDDAVSYRAGLMYEFASGFTPYISYGESFVPVIAEGGPFDPQKGRMYELGFKYQPPGANFAINSAIYDISESNRLEYFPGYAVQTGAVAIKGFEIELTGKVTENLKVVGGYSYTDAQYDGEENKGNQLESVPKHLASMWGIWSFDQPYLKGWSVGAGVRYIGESWDSSNTHEVPDVTLFDAMIAYEEDDWRWSINAKNLEDKEYISTCLNRGDCWYGTARTITTGLTYKF